MFKKGYILAALLILLISMVFVMQYSYMNQIIIKNKEMNIEKSVEILGYKITSKLNQNSQVIESTATMITASNWSGEEIAVNLNKMLRGTPVFSILYYGDADNTFINAMNLKEPKDYEVTMRPWYTKAVDKKTLVYSEAYLDSLTGELAIAISKPIYKKNGQVRGVVGGDILITEIIKLVEEVDSDNNSIGYSFLVDGKGSILAHPDYKYDDYSELKNINQVSHLLWKEMQKNPLGKMQISIDEVDGYLSYQPIEGTDWILGNFASLTEYNASGRYLLMMLGITLLIALGILGLFLMMQKRYFMRPLGLLIRDIEAINMEKDLAYRMPIDEKDPFLQPRESVNDVLEKAEFSFRKQQEYSEELMASHEELKAQNVQLYHLSNYDHLTQLYNRRSFESALRKMDTQENLPLGIIMADVNGLKLINDSFGHEVGDQLLQETGKILRKGCPNKELVFRVGGDEFVIILPKTSPKKAQAVIRKISSLGIQVSLHNIKLSVSFGLGIKSDVDENIANVVKKAEDDMYSNKLVEGPSMRSKTIDTIVHTLYEKNAREKEHSTRVSSICQQIGIELDMSDYEIRQLGTVGLLHDIGKIAVSNDILEKPGPLTQEEWTEMAKHPEVGYRILGTTSEMGRIAEYALSHHERYDGGGYPQGLKGEEIPLVSRIITIADAYDAMVSDRPYRKGLPEEVALEEMIINAGTQFDPELARLFVEKVLKKEWKEISK